MKCDMYDKCTKTDCGMCDGMIQCRRFIPERPTGKWQPLSLKTLNGDDIVAYESSCCRAIADKKYKHCPKCGIKMDEGEK